VLGRTLDLNSEFAILDLLIRIRSPRLVAAAVAAPVGPHPTNLRQKFEPTKSPGGLASCSVTRAAAAAFIWSANVKRRQMTKGQIAMVAAMGLRVAWIVSRLAIALFSENLPARVVICLARRTN
jgi:hypothetical protein